MNPNTRRAQAGLAFAAGAAAALGHAPFGLWPVALVGFGALAFLQTVATGTGRAALVGWAGGAGYFAVALHWIIEPFLVDAARHGWMAPFALILMAGGLALFWGLAGWITAKIGGPKALVWSVALAGAELARGHVLTGFPWALPAYIWTETSVRVTAAYLGPYGLSLVTLALVALPVTTSGRGARAWRGGVAALGVAALFAVGTLGDEIGDGEGFRFRMVQPNAPQSEKWDPALAQGFVDRAIDFTAAAKTEFPPELIVWPETAVPYVLDRAGPVLGDIARASEGIPVLTGLNRREGPDWFNAAVLIESGGRITQSYDKVHLVPFGEYIPLKIGFLRRMAGFAGFGFTPGAGVRTMETPLGRALPLICYEAIFPGHIRRAGERPDYLLQITNDAWFGTFAGPYQHLQQAQFRAAEQGLPLVRVANTGVSAMIDARGEVKVSIPLGVAGFVDAQLPEALAPTPYSRTGDLPAVIIVLGVLGGLALRRRRNAIA